MYVLCTKHNYDRRNYTTEIKQTWILPPFIWCRDALKKGCYYLTFCTNSYMASNGSIWSLVNWLLNADICKRILSKYRTCIKIGCHKATVARKGLGEKMCDKYFAKELYLGKLKYTCKLLFKALLILYTFTLLGIGANEFSKTQNKCMCKNLRIPCAYYT